MQILALDREQILVYASELQFKEDYSALNGFPKINVIIIWLISWQSDLSCYSLTVSILPGNRQVNGNPSICCRNTD